MKASDNLFQTLRRPAAFLPIAMSFIAVAIVMIHIVFSGAAPQSDEGTAAHLWQLLMAAQLPIIAFFVDAMAAEVASLRQCDSRDAGRRRHSGIGTGLFTSLVTAPIAKPLKSKTKKKPATAA